MAATPPPATTWQGGQQQEYTQTGNPALDTENGLDLITEAGATIVLEDVSETTFPITTWVQKDNQ